MRLLPARVEQSRPDQETSLTTRSSLTDPADPSSELEGHNIAGARGKGQVNTVKVNKIKKNINSFYPAPACEEASQSEWRDCRKAMDEFLCEPNCCRRQ